VKEEERQANAKPMLGERGGAASEREADAHISASFLTVTTRVHTSLVVYPTKSTSVAEHEHDMLI
jgi:hypothetical protein